MFAHIYFCDVNQATSVISAELKKFGQVNKESFLHKSYSFLFQKQKSFFIYSPDKKSYLQFSIHHQSSAYS
jgi:hypothetical protein